MIGYSRVSTDGQEAEGASLDAQRAAIDGWALSQSCATVTHYVDVASARTLDRPGLRAALAFAQGDGAPRPFVVVKLDRLTRSVRDLGELLAGPFASVPLVAVRDAIDTGTAAGRLVLHMLCSVAQWEREAIGERTREALAHLQRQGTYLGKPPYGSRAGRDATGRRVLVEAEDEQRVLALVRRLLGRGVTRAEILSELRTMAIPTRTGRVWSAKVLGSVLRRIRAEKAPLAASQL